ncbi:MAG: GIY-YIG nuclease family protein [Ignavibacteriae bacterium]|nr:GIY-YIG nuclease family protein [Ignavibacteriota bacterium]NOG98020.1 GIY-YIG nuclease family protein [Ignavibacteriota bacterium]
MFYVYVIYSKKFDKIYIGQTMDLEIRLEEHNDGLSNYTKKFIPWELVYSEKADTRSDALIREKQLKSSRGRSFIWKEIIGKDKY